MSEIWRAVAWDVQAIWNAARRAVTAPGPERDTTVQSLKAAGAGVLAWALAGWWWSAPMALLAPWTALFIVQSTVYRSVRSALQQFAVVVTGTLLAAGGSVVTGNNSLAAMAIVLPVTVLLSGYARFGTQGVYAPTAALFVLAYGTYTGFDILHRLFETVLGAVIGIVVNAVVLPPVHGRDVRHLRARLAQESAELLYAVADGVERNFSQEQAATWHDRAQRLTDLVTDLRTARRWSHESYRLNPGRKLRRSEPLLPSADWDFAWDRISDQVRVLLRTLAETSRDRPALTDVPAEARQILTDLLRSAGDICALDDYADAEARADAMKDSARTGSAPPGGVDRTAERQAALRAAQEAHDRLVQLLRDGRHEVTPALGGLAADTQRLLGDLAVVAAGRPSDGSADSEEAGAEGKKPEGTSPMQHSDREHNPADRPAQTAAEEVFEEVEDAETRPVPDERREHAKDGEAGDTLTPSPTAQEDIHRDTKDGTTGTTGKDGKDGKRG
ncbi:aromatic acid exporter family protein [Streptomyces sp. NPDC018029]|uniref:aromatic acid exporter family protein n=1 Tax=Streptomyces sp. NPDC018029 TaxID=3365032 RepID=UPI0037B6BABB